MDKGAKVVVLINVNEDNSDNGMKVFSDKEKAQKFLAHLVIENAHKRFDDATDGSTWKTRHKIELVAFLALYDQGKYEEMLDLGDQVGLVDYTMVEQDVL